MPDTCPFCEPNATRVWMENAVGVVLWCAFPVTQGRSLVAPRKHVASIYELSPDETGCVGDARQQLLGQMAPDGFNVGVNDGAPAGQTVPHAHIHVIPRRTGDVPDPRGVNR